MAICEVFGFRKMVVTIIYEILFLKIVRGGGGAGKGGGGEG